MMSSDNDSSAASDGNDLRDDELGRMIRSAATRHPAPAALRQRIMHDMRGEARTSVASSWRVPAWMTLGAGIACGALGTWLVLMLPLSGDPSGQTENEVIAAHSRSLMAAHAIDVASSDQHVVKPWLSSRLDFSPAVADLAGDGFPLIGGRLDYVAQRPVAALVYRRQQHVLNVFVWPASSSAGATEHSSSQRGLWAVRWVQGGLQYWVVTDLGSGELSMFTQKLRQRIEQERGR